MPNTNVNPPEGKNIAKAQTIPEGATQQNSTSGSFDGTARTVSVKATQGEVRLRYAPIHPKPTPEQSK